MSVSWGRGQVLTSCLFKLLTVRFPQSPAHHCRLAQVRCNWQTKDVPKGNILARERCVHKKEQYFVLISSFHLSLAPANGCTPTHTRSLTHSRTNKQNVNASTSAIWRVLSAPAGIIRKTSEEEEEGALSTSCSGVGGDNKTQQWWRRAEWSVKLFHFPS